MAGKAEAPQSEQTVGKEKREALFTILFTRCSPEMVATAVLEQVLQPAQMPQFQAQADLVATAAAVAAAVERFPIATGLMISMEMAGPQALEDWQDPGLRDLPWYIIRGGRLFMAHQTNIAVNGVTVPVWEFDHTAQEIDDAVDRSYAAVRPNLLDNSYFVGGGTGWGVFPVNQRGQISYPSSGNSIDRWKLADATLDLLPSGLKISSTKYNNNFSQFVESWDRLVGQTLTVSVLVESVSGGTVILGINNAGGAQITGPGLYQKTFTATAAVNRAISLAMNPGTSIVANAMKLELGEGQTLAFRDSGGAWKLLPQDDMDYQMQLAKCQAYQIELNYRKLQNPTIGTVVKGNSNSWYAAIPIPTTMRTAPAISVKNGTLVVECTDGAIVASGLTPISVTANMALFVVKFDTAPPSAVSGTLYVAGSGETAPSIILDANL